MSRRWQDPQSASDLGRLDPEAIARVRSEAWPDPVNAEELHDALLWLGCLTEEEVSATPVWRDWLEALAQEKRVARLIVGERARPARHLGGETPPLRRPRNSPHSPYGFPPSG